MPRLLFDGLVEYSDGTPATTSQMAKDVGKQISLKPCDYTMTFLILLLQSPSLAGLLSLSWTSAKRWASRPSSSFLAWSLCPSGSSVSNGEDISLFFTMPKRRC